MVSLAFLGTTAQSKMMIAGSIMGVVWIIKFLWQLVVLHSFSYFIQLGGAGVLIFPVLMLIFALFGAFMIAAGRKTVTRIIAVIYGIAMVSLTIAGFADPLLLALDWMVVLIIIRAAISR